MADTLKPRPSRRKMLVLLGVLLLGVVAAAWGFWSRIRERHGRDNGWQHLCAACSPTWATRTLLAGVGSSAQHEPAQELGEHLVDQPHRHRGSMPGFHWRQSSRSAGMSRISGTRTVEHRRVPPGRRLSGFQNYAVGAELRVRTR